MNKLICRVLPVVGLLADILLMIDILADLKKKFQDRNNETESPVAEEAAAVEV